MPRTFFWITHRLFAIITLLTTAVRLNRCPTPFAKSTLHVPIKPDREDSLSPKYSPSWHFSEVFLGVFYSFFVGRSTTIKYVQEEKTVLEIG